MEANDIGKITIINGENNGLCIAAGKGLNFEKDNKKYVIATTGGTNTPFVCGASEYVPVKHSMQYIIRDKFDSGKLLFKYK